MGTRLNRYYNNPAIGQAISNLASIFEPPAPQDVLAYAQAEKVRAEKGAFDNAQTVFGDPAADASARDRAGVLAGLFNPTSGFEARDMSDATSRRGQDVSAASSRYGSDRSYAASTENNVRDNSRAVQTNLTDNMFGLGGDIMQPLNQGQVRPGLSDDWATMLGVPTVDPAAGAPKPLSETEVVGQNLADAIDQGFWGPEDEAIKRGSEVNIEQIIDPEGNPINAPRVDAIGQQPYNAPGSAPAKLFKTYVLPDGTSGLATLDPTTGGAVDQATKQPLPQGAIIGDVQDTAGGMTTGVNSDIQRSVRSNIGFLSTLDQLANLVKASPSSQGIVGALRGTAQNVIQTGGELGAFFGGTVAEAAQAAKEGAIDTGLASEMFDQSLPAIDMLANVLAWQYAKSMGGDRVSNEQLRTARAAIGSGQSFANQADLLARLEQLRAVQSEQLRRDAAFAPPDLQMQASPYLTPAAPAAPAAPPAPAAPAQPARPRAADAAGNVVEWDGTAWVPAR